MASANFINECKNPAYMNRYGKILISEPTTPTASPNLEITDARESKALDFKLSKLSTQDGTPSPSNPVEVNTVKGYRNLFDESQLLEVSGWELDSNGYYTGNAQNLKTVYGTSTNGFSFDTSFKANTQYTITLTCYNAVNNGNARIDVLYTDTTSNYSTVMNNTTAQDFTFTTTAGKTVQSIRFNCNNNATNIYIKNMQIIEGTQVLSYVSYGTNWIYATITDGTNTKNIPLPLNDNEIVGISTYKDELIVDKNGHCWINKKTKKVVLDGTETLWAMASNGIIYNYDNVFNNTYLVQNAFSNYFENVVDETITGTTTANIALQNNQFSFRMGTKDRLFIKTDIVSNIADFKTWLSTHNLIVYFVLATPQLIDLNYTVDMSLYEGTNTITNSENAYMSMIYKKTLELNQSNKIQEFSIDSGCYVDGNIAGSVYSKKLNTQLIDALDYNIEDMDCDASVGVTYEDNDNEVTEYINLGKYIVEKPKDEQTTNFSSFVAYDLLMNHLEEKYSTSLDYDNETITIADVYEELCTNLGLTPVTTTFTNSTIVVDNNPFGNGETNRTVLQSICKVACAFVDIDYDTNKIDLKWLSNTLDYTFQKSDYSTVEGGKTVYGPVNSLIIKNSVIDSENVSYSDSASILQNGEHQLVISEDYFLYNQEKRTEALTAIWNKVNGLTYVECTLKTALGKPFLKIGNKIRIYTDTNEYFDSYVLQNEFKYDGTFYSTIKCPVLTEQEIKTKQKVSLNDKMKQTEVIINKQDNTITEIVGQINETNEVLNGVIVTTTESERKIEVISTNIDENGEVTSVKTTDGFTFNNDGMNITKSGETYNTQHTYRGSYFKDGNTIVGQVDVNGGKFKNVDLYGVYRYGKNSLADEPMFIAQLYTDSNNEECFGHFWNGG